MNLTEVILEDGKVIHSQEEFSENEFRMPDGNYPIVRKTPLDLTITNKGKKVLELKGKMDAEVLIPCARCLENVPASIHIDFDEEIDMKLSDEERTNALDASDFLHGYNLDVDRLVLSEALLVWPMKVLCKPDCKGLCPVCGQNLNIKTCGCDRTVLDPRMAKIRALFNDFKEV